MLGRGGDAVHQEPDSDDDASDGPPPLMDSDSDDGTGTAGRIQQQEEYDVVITACLCKLRHLFCNCHALYTHVESLFDKKDNPEGASGLKVYLKACRESYTHADRAYHQAFSNYTQDCSNDVVRRGAVEATLAVRACAEQLDKLRRMLMSLDRDSATPAVRALAGIAASKSGEGCPRERKEQDAP